MNNHCEYTIKNQLVKKTDYFLTIADWRLQEYSITLPKNSFHERTIAELRES